MSLNVAYYITGVINPVKKRSKKRFAPFPN